MGVFIRKWRRKESVKREHFNSRFNEEWEAMEKYDRTKVHELRMINWGKLGPVRSDFSQHPSVFGTMEAPFLWVWVRHLSQEGLLTYFRDINVLWPTEGEVREHLHLPFLKFLQFKYSVQQGAILWTRMSWTLSCRIRLDCDWSKQIIFYYLSEQKSHSFGPRYHPGDREALAKHNRLKRAVRVRESYFVITCYCIFSLSM